MKTRSRASFAVPALLVIFLAGSSSARAAEDQPIPLTHVHAHNDYAHVHPLFDALACGFCSVEADIFLVNGQLPVAHSRGAIKPDRTLQSLYLDPLRKRIRENGGRVYRGGPPVWLLIDFKTDPRTTYPVLRSVLERYADILTSWRDGVMHQGAVTAILTGAHPAESVLAAEKIRLAAIDGTLETLDRNPPASLVPWMSSQWGLTFHWHGRGEIPPAERAKMLEIVARAHAQGRLARFWGAPDNVTTWTELRRDGVDLINTDNLRGAEKFLLAQRNSPATSPVK